MKRQDLSTLRKRVAKVSEEPGVYRWKDAEGEVLYVGKAKSLKKRMQSYVRPEAKHGAWTEMMVRQIADYDTTITSSELESLILETNLIKKLRPKYNILMKDDKNYVYVRITTSDRYPRVELVRGLPDDHSAKTFGPFLGKQFTERTLEMLDSILHFRACKQSLDASNKTSSNGDSKIATGKGIGAPCLDYQIGRCNGLCIGAVSETEYRECIDEVIRFFKGNLASVKKKAQEQMKEAAANKKFEKAAKIRDVIQFIEDLEEKQVVSDTSGENADIFGVALRRGKAQVALLRERDGKVIEHIDFPLQGSAETVREALEQFVPQYYGETKDFPDIVLIPEEIEGAVALGQWLTDKRGKTVHVHVPERGKKSRLLDMAARNAEQKVEHQFAAWEAESNRVEGALLELGTLLGFKEPPRRIEGYDISHLGGSATVGSMVVFINGKAKREHYRSFNIRSVSEGDVDDYKSLGEVLKRRLKYITQDLKTAEKQWKDRGILVGKAKKGEQQALLDIIKAHPTELDDAGIDYREFIVARESKKIVGFGRIHLYEDGTAELGSIFIEENIRGQRLGHVIARKLLKVLKAKKAYVVIKPAFEEYYAELGFKTVLTAPKPLLQKEARIRKRFPDEAPAVFMMYEQKQNKPDPSFTDRPDLLLIDGGKGQLSTVVDVLSAMHISIPSAGLAKREEEIFLPGRPDSLAVPDGSQARFLLQRIRDEAHRFANSLREKRLDARLTASKLDEIPGIGDGTKHALMKKFGSADSAIAASDQELSAILTKPQLEAIRKVFPSQGE